MKKYIRKTLDYTASGLFNKIVLIIFLPIFTRLLKPEEFAVYANLTIFITFAGLLYSLGIQQSLYSYFYEKKTEEYQFTLISSVYISLVIIGIIFSAIIILIRNNTFFRKISDSNCDLFILIGIIVLTDMIYGITLNFLNMKERSWSFAVLSMIKNILFLLLIISGVIFSNINLHKIFLYLAVSSIFSAIIAFLYITDLLKKLGKDISDRIFFSFSNIKPLLKFGIVMIPGTLALIIMRLSDRYMLTYLSENALYDVGIYAIGYRVGMIMHFAVSIISTVYYPYAMQIEDKDRAGRSSQKIYNNFVFWGGILGILIILFSSEIFYLIIGKAYSEAVKIVFVGVISAFLSGIYNITKIGQYVEKKAGNILACVGSGAILNIILNYFLIRKFGIYGAGFASIIAYFFIVSYNFISVRKLMQVRYNFSYTIISTSVLFIAAGVNFLFENNLKLFLYKSVGCLIFMIIVIIFYNNREKVSQTFLTR